MKLRRENAVGYSCESRPPRIIRPSVKPRQDRLCLAADTNNPTHDPPPVLSELPGARVLSRRRRATAALPLSSIHSATSSSYLAFAEQHGLRIDHVILTPPPRRFHRRPPGAARSRRRAHLSRRGSKGGIRVHRRLPTATRIELGQRARCRRSKRPDTRRSRSRSRSTTSIAARRAPHAVLTGDTLFVGDVGPSRPARRPRLGGDRSRRPALRLAANEAAGAAGREPGLPAHGAGSLCGKAISKETVSTIGEQRRLNYALQPMTKSAFVELVTARSARRAVLFHLRRRPEQQGAADAGRGAGSRAEPDDARAGARAPARPAGRSSTRATRRSLRPRIWPAASTSDSADSTRPGRARSSSRDRPIVIIADPGREHEAAMRLGRIGFDHIVGYLQGWAAEPRGAAGPDGDDRARQRAAGGGAARRRQRDSRSIVRTPGERAQKAVPGASVSR